MPPSQGHAPTPLTKAQAARAFAAFTAAFYAPASGKAYFHTSTAGGHADFWKQAEMIEMVEDAYGASAAPAERQMVVDLLAGAQATYGRKWIKRRWNDDIMWMVIASLRAYQITADKQYLALAEQNFDGVYARAWSSDLGGGLWWTTARTQKNVTTNAPAAIAACLLYQITHDRKYLSEAVGLYAWVRGHLYNAATGVVYDSISVPASGASQTGTLNRVILSYNQGSFIGAADLLHAATGQRSYYDDALRTLQASRKDLTANGILRSESLGNNSNGGGFKGIFCRWAVRFAYDNHITAFNGWFTRNAETAWAHRNLRDLMGQDWPHLTGNGPLYSFDCSCGVVLMEVLTSKA